MEAPNRIVAFDGLRGLLALSVVGFHIGLCLDRPWLFGHGALAVDIFFVMSGVVISRAYGEMLGRPGAILAFARARWVRLYPLYMLGALVGAAAALIPTTVSGPGKPLAPVLSAIFMAAAMAPASLGPGQSFPLNGPSWSLMSEAIANAAYALTARRPRLLALLLLFGAGVVTAAALQPEPLLQGGVWSNLPTGVGRALFGFTAGVLLQRAAARGAFARAAQLPTLAPLAAAALLVMIPRGPIDRVFDPLAVLVLSPLVVVVALCCAQGSSRVLSGLGALSYPLYVIHTPVFMLVQNTASWRGVPDRFAWAEFLLAAPLAVAAAIFIARKVEPALTRLAKRMTTAAPRLGRPIAVS